MTPRAPTLAVLLILALVVAFAVAAFAHEPYSGWRQPDNPDVSCCNNNDCRATRAYVADDGIWWAWDGQKFIPVPPGRVLPPDHAGDGRSHLCESGGHVYCFTPGQVRG